jgi:hypothetical protein
LGSAMVPEPLPLPVLLLLLGSETGRDVGPLNTNREKGRDQAWPDQRWMMRHHFHSKHDSIYPKLKKGFRLKYTKLVDEGTTELRG